MTGRLVSIGFEECFSAVSASATVDVLDRAAKMSTTVSSQTSSDLPSAQFSAMAGESLMFGHMGFIPGLGMCVKTGMQAPGNATRGLDTVQAEVLLFDSATGVPLALVDGRAITIMRTAGALISGVREVLALRGVGTSPPRVAVIGYGAEGRHIARLAREVLGAERIRAFNRSRTSAEEGVAIADSIIEAVEGADVIACATSSAEPVLTLAEVRAGQHDSVGSDVVIASLNSHQPDKSELDPLIIDASASVHLDLNDPEKFGPIARLATDRKRTHAEKFEMSATVRILGQPAAHEPSGSSESRALRTVLIGGHGLQDSLMAWTVLLGWASVEKATSQFTNVNRR